MIKVDWKLVKVLVDKGVQHKEIAKIVKCKTSYITKQCSLRNIKAAIFWTPQEDKTLKYLINKGLTYREISVKMNKTKSIVENYCYNHDIKYKAGREPVSEEKINDVIKLLKQQLTTTQIRKLIPGLSQRQILYYKAKHQVEGVRRGGVGSIPEEEIAYLRILAAQGITVNQMCKGMMAKFGGRFVYNQIRGRCRCYNIPIAQQKIWEQNEISLLSELVNLGMSFDIIKKRFRDKSPKSIRCKMKAIKTGY